MVFQPEFTLLILMQGSSIAEIATSKISLDKEVRVFYIVLLILSMTLYLEFQEDRTLLG